MSIGIYSLYWKIPDLIYIGQSSNIEVRFYEHKRLFKNGEASSKKLKGAYKKYGEPEYSVLLECLVEELDVNEESLIKEFDSVSNGLNTISSIFGVGKDTSHAGSKYTETEIVNALQFAVDNPSILQKDICGALNISSAVFSSIICGRRHTWVKEKYPILWDTIQVVRTNRKSVDRYVDNPKQLIHLDGTIVNITNISKFTKEYGLCNSHISEVLSKIRLSHKGWKLLT